MDDESAKDVAGVTSEVPAAKPAVEQPAERPRGAPSGRPPGFLETLLADIEWSGGPVNVADDTDPEEWRNGRFEVGRLLHASQQLGFYATLLYRVSRWCRLRGLSFISGPLQLVNHSLTGAEISHNADIGPGLRITHPQGVFVGPGVKVGIRSTFTQGTALSSNLHLEDGSPEAGHYLYMSPGGKVFGRVKVGDRVWIGPNSVALKDVEDDKVVLGVPGRAMPSTFRNRKDG